MKASIFLLAFFSLFLISMQAQESGLDAFSSFHESVLAKNHQYKSSHWGLSANVAGMKVWHYSAAGKAEDYMMMSYQFNDAGYLYFWMKGDSSKARQHFAHRTFAFGADGKLQKITHYEPSQQAYTLSKTFDTMGYLQQISYQSKEDSTLNFTSQIEYFDEFQAMQIEYIYETEPGSWERRVTENYQFSFDKSGLLIREDMQSRYAYTKSFEREKDTGKILKSHHLDACFPSNSCVNLTQNFTYDEAGNLIKISSLDLTVRNSMWTLGENFEATYNEQNLIIKKQIAAGNYLFSSPSQRNAIQHLNYEYIFDERGNWIKRIESQDGQAINIIERELSYFD